jgi:hypothetical protein
MINNAIHSALISILKAKRQKMNPAIRKRRAKPARWLYPRTTEAHYGKAIRAWFRPMQDYVKKYLKEHSEAILHGDSETSVLRNDAGVGRSFYIMVRSLDAWVGKYIPDFVVDEQGNIFSGTESPIYSGLENIADTVFDFNGSQYEKSAKAGLGIDFPVNEDWWPIARERWSYNNYKATGETFKKYVREIEALTEQAVTSGWSLSMLEEKIKGLDEKLESRARFIAHDQIGKLNGEITRCRMEAAGLSMYVWSTSGDERVRESHQLIDEGLCRLDDSTVYSPDGGKTWIDRPADWCQLHPNQDYQCRCTALAYWNEIVDEVDEKIVEYEELEDLSTQNIAGISKNNYNISNNATKGSQIMTPPRPPASSHNQNNQQLTDAQRKIANIAATADFAKRNYPKEDFISDLAQFEAANKFTKGLILPEGVSITTSRIPNNTIQREILRKELKQAEILAKIGSSIYLIPEQAGYKIKAKDAIVNGKLFEFRTVNGNADTFQWEFRNAKKKGADTNVYINVLSSISKDEARHRIWLVLRRHPEYTGQIIMSFDNGSKTYFWDTEDFR